MAEDLERMKLHGLLASQASQERTFWWDSSGQELDDKCAWAPPPFFGIGGFAYQWEWSNKARACVKTG